MSWRDRYNTDEAQQLEQMGLENARRAIADGVPGASPYTRQQRRMLKRQLAREETKVAKIESRRKRRWVAL